MLSLSFHRKSLLTRVAVVTLLLFLAGIWSLAFFVNQILRKDLEQVLGEQQASAAKIVADQLGQEILARTTALETIAARAGHAGIGNVAAMQALLEQRQDRDHLFNAGLRIANDEGETIASIPFSAERLKANYKDRDYLKGALQGRVTIGRPVEGRVAKAPVIGIAVPIFSADRRIIGAVTGAINLAQPNFLDAVAGNIYGRTGGYLLISHRDNVIVTGSDKSRINTPGPASGKNKMHDLYLSGYEGHGVATNSRGVEELSAAFRVRGTDWFVASVLPTSEAFAPVQRLQERLWVSLGIFSLLAGVLLWWQVRRLLRRSLSPLIKATQDLEKLPDSNAAPAPLAVSGLDEISHLIVAFNRLIAVMVAREKVLNENVTERQNAEAALRESEQHFRTLADGGTALIWTAGTDKLCNYFNQPWLRFTGRTLEQEMGNGWAEGVHPDDFDRCLDIYTTHFDRREAFEMEYRLRDASGTYRWILDQGNPRHDSEGRFIGYIGFCYDISERKQWEAGLKLSASVFSHVREGILITNAANEILDVNPAFTRITGYERSEVLGRNPRLLASGRQDAAFYSSMWASLASDAYWSGEVWNRRKSGEVYLEMLTITAVPDGNGKPQHYVGLFSDITMRKEHENELEHHAHHDALTGLPNRALFHDRLRQALHHADRDGSLLGIAFIDLDGFKSINDRHGHDVGDQVLVAVAQRMKKVMREGDTLARQGGDEFIAVLSKLGDMENAGPLIDRLLVAVLEPIQVGELQLKVSASIGVSFYPQEDNPDADGLQRQADQAMYKAKVDGKNRWCAYQFN